MPKYDVMNNVNLNKTKSIKMYQKNIAEQLIQTSLTDFYSISPNEYDQKMIQAGCSGSLAENLWNESEWIEEDLIPWKQLLERRKKNPQLHLKDVVWYFEQLGLEQGFQSQKRKNDILQDMYNRCQNGVELKFLVRLLSPSGLRIGLSSKSMETSFLEFLTSLPSPKKEEML